MAMLQRGALWLQLGLLLLAGYLVIKLAVILWHWGVWQDLFGIGK
jgi:hypothetical protein